MAGEIDRHDLVACGEVAALGIPPAHVAEPAVNEHQRRRTATGRLEVDRRTIGRQPLGIERHCSCS